jgi:hypothetical protein
MDACMFIYMPLLIFPQTPKSINSSNLVIRYCNGFLFCWKGMMFMQQSFVILVKCIPMCCDVRKTVKHNTILIISLIHATFFGS